MKETSRGDKNINSNWNSATSGQRKPLSSTEAFSSSDQNSSTKGTYAKHDGRKVYHSGFKQTSNASTNEEYRPKCVYCKDSHYSDECPRIKSASQRRKILESESRCFLCLRAGHGANRCRSEKPCFHCKKVKAHHTSLCPIKEAGAAIKQRSEVSN